MRVPWGVFAPFFRVFSTRSESLRLFLRSNYEFLLDIRFWYSLSDRR